MNHSAPGFDELHSRAIRIWHWLFFLFLLSTITTVIFASYVFGTGQNISLVQNQLQQKGVTVDQPAARAVSHAFNDKLWTLHTWIGYGIAFLVLARFLLEFVQPANEKVTTRIRYAMQWIAPSPKEDTDRRYYLIIKWTYIVFYGLILIMALTGLGLALEDVPFFRSLRKTIKSVHALIQYPIYGFIIIHIAGVVRADLRRYPGLISSMINGKPGRRIDL